VTAALHYVLLADGGRDRALRHVIDWAIQAAQPELKVRGFTFCKREGPVGAAIRGVVDRYRPELLFVHRDAEAAPLHERRAEIPLIGARIVRVVPVRMTEAWLLFDEGAIRLAAGRPHGREPVGLPPVRRLDRLADPKRALAVSMLAACGTPRGRRRERASRDEPQWCERVAARVADFAPLRVLPAFQEFEEELHRQLLDWLDASRAGLEPPASA
jgi:hypothetical protein